MYFPYNRVPKSLGLRGSGLNGVPGLRTKVNSAPGLRRNRSRAPGSPMLFCFNPKASPRIEKIQQFLFFKRCFYKFFSTLLVFHSYLELFINHNQWMLEGDRTGRSIFEFKNYLTVNHGLPDVAKKFGIQQFTVEISIHRCKKPGRRSRSFQMVECSHVRMVFYYLRSVSQQTTNKHVMTLSVCKNVRILVLGAMGSAANVLRAPGSTEK